MSINFKFRSSATFDAVDLGGRSSITIRDLRSQILNKKRLNLFPDVELLISDIDGRVADILLPVCCSDVLKDPSANEGSTLEVKSDDMVDRCAKLVRASSASLAVTQTADLPCSVCLVLSREGKCPICSSSKCRQGDLLPNLSLRQAIRKFLESRLLVNNSEADPHGYAPDVESGIEVKDASCALTIGHDNRQQPRRPSHFKHKFSELEDGSEFQGENQPSNVLEVHEEEDEFCVYQVSIHEFKFFHWWSKNLNAVPRQKKVSLCGAWSRLLLYTAERTCYMCGSPDHLIRDCPVAASSRADYRNDMAFAGASPRYGPPYWHRTQFSQARPLVNMCGSHMMMPYSGAIGPQFQQHPFAVPAYNPNIYGGFPLSR
ncbi:hypothetical protein AKJ16_DCAP17155 [Drosera capensis]